MVVRKAAEVLDLQLPSVETKTTVLIEVLHQATLGPKPMLPFNESLTDILLGAWTKPCTGAPSADPLPAAIDLPLGTRPF